MQCLNSSLLATTVYTVFIFLLLNEANCLPASFKSNIRLVQASNEFAFSVYKSMHNDSNILFSPWSLSLVLSMVYLGARNETAREMADVLRLGNISEDKLDVFNGYKDQGELMKSSTEDVSTLVSNLALVQTGYNISQTYLASIQKYYDSGVITVDFTDAESVLQLVNDEVSKATNGNIKKILEEAPDPVTKLMLLNSVYFRGTWEKMFDPNDTTPGVFYGADNVTSVEMMHLKSKFLFVYDPVSSFYAIDIPYKNREMSMLIMMPTKSEKSLERLESNFMSASFLDSIVGRLEKRYFELTLPKFRMEASLEMKDILSGLGMSSVFSPADADLSGISAEGELYLQQVHHKSTLDVTEEGTEASASSAAIIVSRIGAPKFMVDRPFFFVIRHKITGLNLFMGRVLNM